MRARGADFSSYQDDAHLQSAINHGLDFALVKTTEGVHYVNPRARLELDRLHSNGVRTGLYHFLTHDVDGAHQWDFFEQTTTTWTRTSTTPTIGLIFACDQETDEHGVLVPDAVTRAFIRRGQQRGYKVGRYGDARVMGRSLGEDWRWYAHWAAAPPAGRWDVWQFAAGKHGDPDWNVFAGDRAALAAWWAKHSRRPSTPPKSRWWLHDELAKVALGPYRLPRLVTALALYVARHPRSVRFELVRK